MPEGEKPLKDEKRIENDIYSLARQRVNETWEGI